MALWQLIESSRDELLSLFRRRVHETSADDTGSAPPSEIMGLLDELTRSLRAAVLGENPTLLPNGRLLAAELGHTGAATGRDVGQVTADFHALHESILELAERHEHTVEPRELRALARGIHRATASALVHYAQTRDHELQRAHAEHFAFLAHELRGPLSNIKLGLELVDEGIPLSKLVPRIRRSTELMRQLLDNEITRARLSSTSSIHVEPLQMDALVETVAEDQRLHADDRGVTLALDVPASLPVHGDRRLLRSALGNLVANAIKFSHRGGIVTIHGHEDAAHVVLEIADACGGLPEGKAQTLFEPYRQASSDRSGFGLGLAIVSDAIALHEGTIEVRNRPGEGCTMELRLPQWGPAAAAKA